MICKRQTLIRIGWVFLICFVLLNLFAVFHSYRFTHFSHADALVTQKPEQLNFAQKLKALFLGVNNPRPVNKFSPAGSYETVILQSNKTIECWYVKSEFGDSAKGAIILFHGYGGSKSSMLDKAEVFGSLGYNTFLVDFMGSGGSEGNTTTIGYEEARQVKSAYDYITNTGESDVYLFGTSMGAVAIMKAIKDYGFQPKGIILECPFGSMYATVSARFKNMGIPAFPMAGLLVFWGGVQNGFWGFGHNPGDYARSIKCPALLLYGEKDRNVSRKEIDDIFEHLAGRKFLRTYEKAGHENYLDKYRGKWTTDVSAFLSNP